MPVTGRIRIVFAPFSVSATAADGLLSFQMRRKPLSVMRRSGGRWSCSAFSGCFSLPFANSAENESVMITAEMTAFFIDFIKSFSCKNNQGCSKRTALFTVIFYTITPFVEGIEPFRRGSISTALRIARAAALKSPSILWWSLLPRIMSR